MATRATPIQKMTAADVRSLLHRRFPAKTYVCIEEAPTGPERQGGIDFVAISCWKSRRYEIDAIEIKVSYSDWKNELLKPWKNDWWFHHSHRFWIACPSSLAPRIGPELPAGWGLLAVDTDASIYKKAEHRRAPEPLEWDAVVGVMRALAGASYTALDRAYDRGFAAGKATRQSPAEAPSLPGYEPSTNALSI